MLFTYISCKKTEATIYLQADNFFWIFSFWIFVIGACVGSFLNVCIWRIPRGMSIVEPPSSCPSCGHMIRWFENIPILSWIFLRGRCSSCGKSISIRYILIELLCAFLYLMIWLKLYYSIGNALYLFRYLVVAALAVSTFFIDMKYFIIPDITTYPVMIYGIVLSFVLPESFGFKTYSEAFLFSLAGFLFSSVFMGSAAIFGKRIFKKDALGWGDVKYMVAIGANLGFPGAFFTLLFASLSGTLYGIFLVCRRRKNLKATIPFGPFLATATIIWIFSGEIILRMYFYISQILKKYGF